MRRWFASSVRFPMPEVDSHDSLLKRLVLWYALQFPYHQGKWRVIDALVRAFGIETADRGKTFGVQRDNVNWRLNTECIVQRTLYYHGCLDRFASRELFDAVAPGKVFFDVGAYFGYYALRAARRGAQSFAFEPMPGNFAHLQQHLALNPALDVQAIQAAVADQAGTARLALPRDDNRGRGHLVSEAAATEEAIVEVQTVPLDQFVRERGLTRVHAMKIDVEGAEMRVLEGARELIDRDHPVIFMEVNAPCLERFGVTPDQLLERMRRSGYRLVRVDGRGRREFRRLEANEDYANVLCLPG